MTGTYPEAAAIASPARRPWRPRLPGLHELVSSRPPASAPPRRRSCAT